MHKARENNNGSFSIGKTWNLEELSAIESYGTSASIPPPRDERERAHREWAGNVGFTVTITKPYYWQAGTSKEKDFFIASAVKIYRKYTKGQVPELKGFEERDKAMMLGNAAPGPPPAPSAGQQRSASSGVSPGQRAEGRDRDVSGEDMAPPQPPFAQRDQSREGSRYRGSPGPPGSSHDPGSRAESPAPPRRVPSGQVPPPLGPGAGPRAYASQEHMRGQIRQDYHPPGGRPGTSPAPSYQGRASAQPKQQLQTPDAPYTQSARSESPSASVASTASTGGREQLPKVLQAGGAHRSPSRQPSYQQPIDSVPGDRQANVAPQPQINGASAGANLFQATRQRWIGAQQQQQPERAVSGAPQLPPLQTNQSLQPNDDRTPIDRQPRTAASEASSAGMVDLGDAATIGALTSYWGPEPAAASQTPPPQQQPVIQEPQPQPPASPPTPQRSRLRPALQERGQSHQSEASFDLRPPPLKQGPGAGARTSEEKAGRASYYGTPRETASAAQTPRREEPPAQVIRPLSVEKKRASVDPVAPDSNKLAMPGAFMSTPTGPSPLGTPAEEREFAEPPAPTSAPAPAPQPEPQAQAQPQPPFQQPRQVEREAEDDTSSYRPGLGPMVKKKGEVRDRFKKAATAAAAFKPRAGGAAEKILRAKIEREQGIKTNDVDGVSGYVPRPGMAGGRQDSNMSAVSAVSGVGSVEEKSEGGKKDGGDLAVKEPERQQPVGLGVQGVADGKEQAPTTPVVEVTSPLSPAKELDRQLGGIDGQTKGVQLTDEQAGEHLQTPRQEAEVQEAEQALFEQREARKPQVKVKRRSNQQERNLAALGIDRGLLEGRGLEFEATLSDFGWNDTAFETKKLVDIESDLRREAGRLEAGSWLSSTDGQREERVQQVELLLDKAIQECDELEGLLTLYSVELGSLNEDISFIEAQSQGLQVQSANQKLLHRELEELVETMNLDRRVLEPLRFGDLGDAAGLEQVEGSVGRLWQAMVTIDPSLRSGGGAAVGGGRPKSSRSGEGVGEVSSMKALREKREVYDREAGVFVQRLMQHLDYTFTTSFSDAKNRAMRPSSGGAKRLDKEVFADARRGMWMYSPLILLSLIHI